MTRESRKKNRESRNMWMIVNVWTHGRMHACLGTHESMNERMNEENKEAERKNDHTRKEKEEKTTERRKDGKKERRKEGRKKDRKKERSNETRKQWNKETTQGLSTCTDFQWQVYECMCKFNCCYETVNSVVEQHLQLSACWETIAVGSSTSQIHPISLQVTARSWIHRLESRCVLKEGELQPSQVGVVTPYMGQVRRLRRAISQNLSLERGELLVASVDSFQGREKELRWSEIYIRWFQFKVSTLFAWNFLFWVILNSLVWNCTFLFGWFVLLFVRSFVRFVLFPMFFLSQFLRLFVYVFVHWLVGMLARTDKVWRSIPTDFTWKLDGKLF